MKKKMFIVVMLLASLLMASLSHAGSQGRFSHYGNDAFIEAGSGEAMVLDAFILRPVGLVTTVIGGAAFVVSLPFTAIGGNVGEAADKLIVEPIDYTFNRKLGDIEY